MMKKQCRKQATTVFRTVFSFSFHHFPIVTTGWFSPVWVWGWQAVRGHWHWAPRRCPGFPAKLRNVNISGKDAKIPALWKQSPGFWGTPWSLWPLLQDPYHTWWWWDWWTSLVVFFVQWLLANFIFVRSKMFWPIWCHRWYDSYMIVGPAILLSSLLVRLELLQLFPFCPRSLGKLSALKIKRKKMIQGGWWWNRTCFRWRHRRMVTTS